MSKKKERDWLSRLFGGKKEEKISDDPLQQAPQPEETQPSPIDQSNREQTENLSSPAETSSTDNAAIDGNETASSIEESDHTTEITDSKSIEEPMENSSQKLSEKHDDTPAQPSEPSASPTEILPSESAVKAEELEEPEKLIEKPEVTQIESSEKEESSALPKKTGLFARLRSQLSKTRDNLTAGFADLFLGKKEIDEEILEELETRLLLADVGINATMGILDEIREEVDRKTLSDFDGLFVSLKSKMEDILIPVEQHLTIDDKHSPFVILMIGVNGVGKTTTIGKLAKQFQEQGKSVMLAAGDTFRAAAVEQLEVWGERNNIPVISQKEGADPASVVFDAMESAKARKVDILIADTAGRLHTDAGLMQELAKIHRVIKRLDETAPHEVMLVVDASTGQNALNQARQFNEIVPLSGITFTKMDGTAKGGIIFAIADELKIPVRFIGVGEGIDDLRPFIAKDFVDALIGDTKA